MHQHKEGIETSLIDTKTHLDKLHNEITRTLEKINSREKYINNQLEHLLGVTLNIQKITSVFKL
jgi:estrogen-related receptor beta like 1